LKRKNGLILTDILKGIIIGGGAILPGVSGGVLCVLFGIYRPMMELFAHPIKALKKNMKLFIPVIVGWAVGFFLFAKVLDVVFSRCELYATCLFVGLIGGTVPGLYRQAGKNGRTKGDVVVMAGAFILLFAMLLTVRFGGIKGQITPGTFWYVFSGVLWGLSIVVPGMTSSSILLSLGLYQPLTAGISAFDMAVLIPWGLGMVMTALVLGRLINHLFLTNYSGASHAVVGIVLASTLAIIPIQYGGVLQFVICVLCCAAGIACAYLMDKFEITGDNR